MNWYKNSNKKIEKAKNEGFIYGPVYHPTNKINDLSGNISSINTMSYGYLNEPRHAIIFYDNESDALKEGKYAIKCMLRINKTAIIGDNKEIMDLFFNKINPFLHRELWVLAKYRNDDKVLLDGDLGKIFVTLLRSKNYDSARSISDGFIAIFSPKDIKVIS